MRGREGSTRGREKLAQLLFDDVRMNACARDQGGLEKKVERALEEVLCNNGGWIFCKSGGISVVVENGNEVIRRFDGLVVKWCEDNCFVELGFWKM